MQRLLLLLLLVALMGCLVPTATPPSADPASQSATMTPLPTPTPVPAPDTPAGFDQFLAQAKDVLLKERVALTNSYWASIPQTPVVDDSRAIFLYRGDARSVAVIGDMTSWQVGAPLVMERLIGTDLWYASADFPAEARVDYIFLINGNEQIDPTNPLRIGSGFGPRSVLRMPGYVVPEALLDRTEWPAGELHEHVIESDYLSQTRTIFVYTPPGQLVGAKWPSLYVHDGTEAMTLIDMPRLMDTLIGRRDVPPMVVTFIPPIDRFSEYARDDDFANFVAKEVVPFVQETYDTDRSADRTATMGASMGGLISLHLGLNHPNTFGLIASQSGAFSYADGQALVQAARTPRLPLKLHLIIGTYETAINDQPSGDLLTANREMQQILTDKGYTFEYIERPEGHSWGFWETQIGPALAYLFE